MRESIADPLPYIGFPLRFLRRQRRDQPRFYSASFWRFGHDSQCTKTLGALIGKFWIENLKRIHALPKEFFTLQEDDLSFLFTRVLLLKDVNNVEPPRRVPTENFEEMSC